MLYLAGNYQMKEINFQKTNSSQPGQWPLAARADDKQIFFNQDFRPEKVRIDIAKFSAGRFLDFLFLVIAVLGVGVLLLHLFSPVGDLWLRVFIFTLILDCIYWTRIVSRETKPVKLDSVDLRRLFSPRALNHLHKSLLARGNKRAEPVHLVLELLTDKSVQYIFYRLGIGYRQIAQVLLEQLKSIEMPPPAVSEDFAKVPFLAYQAAEGLGADELTPIILLSGIARLSEDSKISQIFSSFSLTARMIFEAVEWQVTLEKTIASRAREYGFVKLRPKGEINRGLTSVPTPILDNFGTDLTMRAQTGRLPVVVGRSEELDKIFSAFSATRQGVLLVGEHGVGKTSIIENLAEKMAAEEVPPVISDRRLVLIQSGQILGQGEHAGQALTAAINDAARGGNIVLACENIHEFAQAQASGVSLVSILISALQDTNIFLIATTTPSDFEKSQVLPGNSFFERIDVAEMSPKDAVLVTAIHASLLESRFKVFWTIEAIEKAVELSSRYIPGSTQPQKAIKVIEVLAERLGATGKTAVAGVQEVEKIVSEMAHVEAEEVSADEADKLLSLEAELHQRVIGQEEAISAVANAMRRVKANLTVNQKRPLASFLFVGPTGVGKTELAKALAEVEFGSEEHMIRLDMSEYNLPQSVDKLLGGASFTSSFVSAVRERPYSVILLDEFEKSNPEIQNIFLQVLDEGHLTDAAGGKLNLTNSLIIATSNAAWEEIQLAFRANLTDADFEAKLTHEILVKYFRPELINRFDGVILFNPLKTNHVSEIVKLQLGKIGAKLQGQGINLRATPEGIEKIAKEAYDQTFGARPLRRYLQDHVENQIATWILSHDLSRRDSVVISKDGLPQIERAPTL